MYQQTYGPSVAVGDTVQVWVMEISTGVDFEACVLVPTPVTCSFSGWKPYYDTGGTSPMAEFEEEDQTQPTDGHFNSMQWGPTGNWQDVTGIDYPNYNFAIAHSALPEKMHVLSHDGGDQQGGWPAFLAPAAATDRFGTFKECPGTYYSTSTYPATC